MSKREIRSEAPGVVSGARSFLSNRFTHPKIDRSLETRFLIQKKRNPFSESVFYINDLNLFVFKNCFIVLISPK